MILVDMNPFLIARFYTWVESVAIENKTEISTASADTYTFAKRCQASLRLLIESLQVTRKTGPNEKVFICLEGYNTWRFKIFPNYKWERIQNKKADAEKWQIVKLYMEAAIKYIVEEFPSIFVLEAEADDVIASICQHYGTYTNTPGSEEILIISRDKDFKQLLKYWNVQIYNPVANEYITLEGKNPEFVLREHIISGDRIDGIPNFLSDSNVFVDGKRQKRLMSAVKQKVLRAESVEEILDEETLVRYNRNKTLIDFQEIPMTIQNEVINKMKEVITL